MYNAPSLRCPLSRLANKAIDVVDSGLFPPASIQPILTFRPSYIGDHCHERPMAMSRCQEQAISLIIVALGGSLAVDQISRHFSTQAEFHFALSLYFKTIFCIFP